jgi:uncharacterized protein YabN with tetrapyrrole methylase and pyrophosphatase domain
VQADASGEAIEGASAHVQEELGDLLFQIIFHAELGDEEDLFNFDHHRRRVRDKLIGRHPHVFGDVQVSGSNEVASRWEVLKQEEKGRESITDGIAWQLPALTSTPNCCARRTHVDVATLDATTSRVARDGSPGLTRPRRRAGRGRGLEFTGREAWGDAIAALVVCAQWAGVDLEGVLRERATSCATRFVDERATQSNSSPSNLGG